MKKLFMGMNNIEDEGAATIKDALSTNGSLKHLDQVNNIRISEQTRNDIASTIRADITITIILSYTRSSSRKAWNS